jgi:hypothetical protein
LTVANVGLALAALYPGVLLGWSLVSPQHFPPVSSSRIGLAFVVLLVATGVTWRAVRRGRTEMACTASWVSGILVLTLALSEMPTLLNDPRSLRSFARDVTELVPAEATLGTSDNHPALSYYFERPLVWVPPADAANFLGSPDRFLVLRDDQLDSLDLSRARRVYFCNPYRKRARTGYLFRGEPPQEIGGLEPR